MRKLATLRKVSKLYPIPKADFIEIAQVDDWQVIVKKGEFQENSNCVFFEIDSLLPDEPRYAFLGVPKDYFKIKKHRLKTMKMRGVISQGLALPLSSFPEIHKGFKLGDDLTELLKIVKYDPETYNNGSSAGTKNKGSAGGKFPSFIPKTDQERIQNLPTYYERYRDHLWEETLKLDGSSLTAYKIRSELNLWQRIKQYFGYKQEAFHFGVCSRNLELKRSDNFKKSFNNDGKPSEYSQSDFWKIVIDQEIEKYLPVGFALQGELIGPKIQANHEHVEQNDYYIFDVYNITEGRYLLPDERQDFFEDYFMLNECIKQVPIVSTSIAIFTECSDLDAFQKRVTGQSINPKTISEGRVYKSLTVPGLSFKCISNQYLLKCED